jgi:large subunit ribosomal protein L12
MEYVYAALILNETGEELNEVNLTNVLEAAGAEVQESRVKALIAALEDVDIDQAVEEASIPAGGAAAGAAPGGAAPGGASPVEGGQEGGQEDVEEADEELPDTTDDDDDDDDEEASGEGLGELFG